MRVKISDKMAEDSKRWRTFNLYSNLLKEIEQMIEDGYLMMPNASTWVSAKLNEAFQIEREAYWEWKKSQ